MSEQENNDKMKYEGEGTGTANILRDSPWFSSEDLLAVGGKDTVTIEKINKYTNVTFQQGRKKPLAYALKFKEYKREYVMNGINRKGLIECFGIKLLEWKGKRAVFFVDPSVLIGGKKVNGVRLDVEATKKANKQ